MTIAVRYTGSNALVNQVLVFASSEFLNTSAGAGDAGKPIKLDAAGLININMMPTGIIKADGTVAFTGNQSMGGFKLTNVADGTGANDAVNLAQLQAQAAGHFWKDAVKVKSNANLASLTGLSLTDFDGTAQGVTLVNGDRVLLGSQTNGAENGIYVIDGSGNLTRATDMDTGSEADNASVNVGEGTYADSQWHQNVAPVTIGTTSQVWIQVSGLGQVTAGAGLSKTVNTLNIGDINRGIQVNTDDLEFAASEAAGTGLAADTNSWQMKIDFSTAYNDAKAVSAADLADFTTAGKGGEIIGARDAGGYYATDTVVGQLQEIGATLSTQDGPIYTSDGVGVTKGDPVYFSGNGIVTKFATTLDKRVLGLALATVGASASVQIARNDTKILGVLSGQTFGNVMYWDGTNHVATIPGTPSAFIWKTGVAINATDLHAEVEFVHKNLD